MRKIWRYVFALYMLLLTIFVIFKFNGSINQMIERIDSITMNREMGFYNYNLKLFNTISPYLSSIESFYAFKNIMGNIVPFIPMGFLIPINWFKLSSFLKTIGLSLLIIISAESIQFITKLGFFDLDDILLNLVGCVIGYLIYCFMMNVRKGKEVKRKVN